jgi:hypothetical protein
MSTQFTQANVLELAQRAGVSLPDAHANELRDQLNGCAFQFLNIAWPQQRVESNSEVKKKLATIESAATKLRGNLDGEAFELIKTGVQLKIRNRGRLRMGLAESQEREALQLLDLVLRALQAVLNGMGGARETLAGRIARTKTERTQHKGNEAENELIGNLWREWRGRPVDPDTPVSAADVTFIRGCLRVIKGSLPVKERELRTRLNGLIVSEAALPDRMARLRERTQRRQERS